MVKNRIVFFLILALLSFDLESCCIIMFPYKVVKGTYYVVKGTVKGTYYAVKGAYELTAGTTHLVYSIGKFTFKVVKAPIDWPLTSDLISSIGGMEPKAAILKGIVKYAPYMVKGKMYYPMSFAKARSYQETGLASWYGYESLRGKHDRMTATARSLTPTG